MRFKGTLTQWNEARGFGFIEPAEGGKNVFCHARSFRDRDARPANGVRVTYSLGRDESGRPRAEDVWLSLSVRTPRPVADAPSHLSRAVAVTTAFFIAISALTLLGQLAWVVPPWYLVLSAFAFAAYGIDKQAAKKNRRRTPERILQFLAVAGGWPGAWVAQQTLRHKSSKRSFQIEFWICVIVNLLLLGTLLWQGGGLPAQWLARFGH